MRDGLRVNTDPGDSMNEAESDHDDRSYKKTENGAKGKSKEEKRRRRYDDDSDPSSSGSSPDSSSDDSSSEADKSG